MKINIKRLLAGVLCCLMLATMQSCKKDEPHHPITWKEWTDATGTKLLRFSHNGRYRDLYDYMHTRKDTYVLGEKTITIYHLFNGHRDTTKAEIVKVDDKNLVLKYRNGFVDKLVAATKLQLIVGKWAPDFNEAVADTFEICKPEYDSKLHDFRGEVKAFHYSVVNDSTLLFDFFNDGTKENVKYFISEDRTMLMLNYLGQRISFVRI